MENKFYVYEWIRLDTNEPFYVGKGYGNRCYKLTRNNNHFNNIVKSIPVAVNILHDNLNEQIAFDLEVWYIREYRDVIGYDLVNITDGGEGCVILGKKHTEESKQKIGKGVSNSWNNKSNEDKENHKNKISRSLQGRVITDEHKNNLKIAMKGKNNGRSKSVICLTTNKIFFTAKEGSDFYNCNSSHITSCCKGRRKSCGKYKDKKLLWKYIIWKHNKKFRII
ncbi:NUMOD3 domain-containing DNA-binding protein [uncultured Clostridium sp.]|uniref:NUMOD3 domain-containing DNA-binding protein n=1 Tax=uncultured Clostridium sp. TaxID=59620 RepID=UPI0026DAA18D|nr:NUMOD3 domain-containing DNA-binding protein [uncultured Clostridium sp.]